MKQKKNALPRPILSPSTRITIWSIDNIVRVRAGKRVCQIPGQRKGRRFLADAQCQLHWGLGSGPWLTDKERDMLIYLIESSSKYSPWLRIRFR